jgi:hypothetical protein
VWIPSLTFIACPKWDKEVQEWNIRCSMHEVGAGGSGLYCAQEDMRFRGCKQLDFFCFLHLLSELQGVETWKYTMLKSRPIKLPGFELDDREIRV